MLAKGEAVNGRRTVGGVCVLSRLQPQKVFALHWRDYFYSGYFAFSSWDQISHYFRDYPPQLHDHVIRCSFCGSRRHITYWLSVILA